MIADVKGILCLNIWSDDDPDLDLLRRTSTSSYQQQTKWGRCGICPRRCRPAVVTGSPKSTAQAGWQRCRPPLAPFHSDDQCFGVSRAHCGLADSKSDVRQFSKSDVLKVGLKVGCTPIGGTWISPPSRWMSRNVHVLPPAPDRPPKCLGWQLRVVTVARAVSGQRYPVTSAFTVLRRGLRRARLTTPGHARSCSQRVTPGHIGSCRVTMGHTGSRRVTPGHTGPRFGVVVRGEERSLRLRGGRGGNGRQDRDRSARARQLGGGHGLCARDSCRDTPSWSP